MDHPARATSFQSFGWMIKPAVEPPDGSSGGSNVISKLRLDDQSSR